MYVVYIHEVFMFSDRHLVRHASVSKCTIEGCYVAIMVTTRAIYLLP